MTLYLLLRYISNLIKVEPKPELKIKCNMKFEGDLKSLKMLDIS